MATPYDENLRNHQNMLQYQQYLASRGMASQGSVAHIQNVVNGIQAQIDNYKPPTNNGGGNGGSGSGLTADQVQKMIDDAAARAAADEKNRRDAEAKAILTGRFREYGGMEGLIDDLDRLIREWGNNVDVIMAKIPETATYQKRFKGLVDLRKKGITDIQNEAEYLRLESDYRSVFREAGMRDFLGVDGSQDQFDAIAELVADYSVSVREVADRVNDAARVVADTSDETTAALRDYYGIDTATLTEFVLDPVRTQNKINEMANAALLGGAAGRTGLDIDRSAAEQIAELSGNSDAVVGQYQPRFTQAAAVRDATARLASLEGSNLTDSEATLSSMDLDAEAKKKVKGLQSRERARFGGSSGISSSSLRTSNG
ncbi:MAG: hypothetical protein L7S55_03390 [Luminiphilus sp.]|nr:hypothetical protein [Luminiphilus sp.]